MSFPRIIHSQGKTFALIEKKAGISGLNPKEFYIDEQGNKFIAKVEKERKVEDIFKDSVSFNIAFKELKKSPSRLLNELKEIDELKTKSPEELAHMHMDLSKELYELKELPKELKGLSDALKKILYKKTFPVALHTHKDELRDAATATSVIASNIAREIFPCLRVPDNHLACLPDGTPIVLSKLLPEEEKFVEFLKETNPIKTINPKKPTDWKDLLKRSELILTEEQANVLGQIYYIALLLGHWDILNNIDLTNSGSVIINNKLMPCIVDWGNCLGIGFGGVSQDLTAFSNPQFKDLELKTGADPLTGFTGSVPFDTIVYPRLPRQLARDLFNLTGDDKISQAMLTGFKNAHAEAQIHFSKDKIIQSIAKTLKPDEVKSFRGALNQELFIGNSLGTILEGRLHSLDDIIQQINRGRKIEEIAQIQFDKIQASQVFLPPAPSLQQSMPVEVEPSAGKAYMF